MEVVNTVSNQVTDNTVTSATIYDEVDYIYATISYDRPSSAVYSDIDNVSGYSSTESLSAVEASYSGLDSSTREPSPAPAVYNTLTKPEYVNTSGAVSEVMRAATSEEPHASNSGISSDVSQSSAPYSQLDSSTLEPPQPPVIYDRLTRHHYVND